jgi:hypothetical protein
MVREIGKNSHKSRNFQLHEETGNVRSIFKTCVDRSEHEVDWKLNRILLPDIDNMLNARVMGHEFRETTVQTINSTVKEQVQSEKQGECGDLLRAIYRDLEAWSLAYHVPEIEQGWKRHMEQSPINTSHPVDLKREASFKSSMI